MCIVLRQCAGVSDVSVWSLHSPRFFLPSLAGQMRFSLEERRTLGRWGPSSGMPVRYDRSRCVTELLLKTDILSKLESGFQLAGPFELLALSTILESKLSIDQRMSSHEPPCLEADLRTESVAVKDSDEYEFVLNDKSMVVHLRDDDEPGKTKCSFWWSQSRTSVMTVRGCRQQFMEYAKCVRCWTKTAHVELPNWSDRAMSASSSSGSESGVDGNIDSSSSAPPES